MFGSIKFFKNIVLIIQEKKFSNIKYVGLYYLKTVKPNQRAPDLINAEVAMKRAAHKPESLPELQVRLLFS